MYFIPAIGAKPGRNISFWDATDLKWNEIPPNNYSQHLGTAA
jgi:hypothetical protein